MGWRRPPATAKNSIMETTNVIETKTLNDSQFNRLRKIIYDRSGIWFADNKKYILESRLARRLEELEIDNFDQYITFVSVGPYRDDEFQEMFNRITINETSFFRNEPQLRVFETQTLTQLLEARGKTKRLRIWSAGCSTGEEPYTIAMLLHRTLGLRLADWWIEILGTDISGKALVAAQTGRYASYAIRATDPLIVRRYFQQVSGFYQLDPQIQQMVQFETLNLKDSFAAKRHGIWDAIFCRNVMIYFDQPMREACLKVFYDMLAPDGALYIGHSESLQGNAMFEPFSDPHAFAYGKTCPGKRNAWRSLQDGSAKPVLDKAGYKS